MYGQRTMNISNFHMLTHCVLGGGECSAQNLFPELSLFMWARVFLIFEKSKLLMKHKRRPPDF